MDTSILALPSGRRGGVCALSCLVWALCFGSPGKPRQGTRRVTADMGVTGRKLPCLRTGRGSPQKGTEWPGGCEAVTENNTSPWPECEGSVRAAAGHLGEEGLEGPLSLGKLKGKCQLQGAAQTANLPGLLQAGKAHGPRGPPSLGGAPLCPRGWAAGTPLTSPGGCLVSKVLVSETISARSGAARPGGAALAGTQWSPRGLPQALTSKRTWKRATGTSQRRCQPRG